MFTTLPFAFFSNGRNALVTSTIPHRLTSARSLNVLIGVHSIGLENIIPALFTSPHSPTNKVKKRIRAYLENNGCEARLSQTYFWL